MVLIRAMHHKCVTGSCIQCCKLMISIVIIRSIGYFIGRRGNLNITVKTESLKFKLLFQLLLFCGQFKFFVTIKESTFSTFKLCYRISSNKRRVSNKRHPLSCAALLCNHIEIGLRPATLLKKRLWRRCFPVNFAKFVRTPSLQNTSGRQLLSLTHFFPVLHFYTS